MYYYLTSERFDLNDFAIRYGLKRRPPDTFKDPFCACLRVNVPKSMGVTCWIPDLAWHVRDRDVRLSQLQPVPLVMQNGRWRAMPDLLKTEDRLFNWHANLCGRGWTMRPGVGWLTAEQAKVYCK